MLYKVLYLITKIHNMAMPCYFIYIIFLTKGWICMRKLTMLFITIIMVMMATATTMTASAYDNSVTIFVNGREVNGVEAFMDGNGTIWVSDSLVAARKLFPEETADLYFPDVVEDRQLQDMANAFGYEMKVEGLTAYLEKGGSSSGETSRPDDDNPSEDREELTIYVDDRRVSGVQAYMDAEGKVWLKDGYSALKKIFPDETDGERFPNLVRDLLLKEYSDQYGYELDVKGTRVYLTKRDTAESVTIYVNDKRVSNVSAYLDEDGEIWLENGYSALKKLFPDETEGERFPSLVRDLLLEDYANEYGYELTLNGNRVNLVKQEIKVYVNDMRINVDANLANDGTVVFDPRDIYTIFPEAANLKLESGVNYSTSLKRWAEYFKYQYIQKGIRVYLVKDWQKPLEIHLQGKIIDFPDQQPYVANNRTMIPVAIVAEAFGCEVEWKGTTVEIRGDGKTIVLYLNSEVYTVNGVEYAMDTPTIVVNNRTIVPVAFVAQALGYSQIEFHNAEPVNIVTIDR